ncbi:ribbon-helix-helix domain-containing protein [Exiguobacterium undae]
MGELRYRQRIGVSVDNLTVDRLNNLADETGVPKSKLVDFAIFLLAEKYKEEKVVKPAGYTDSTEKGDL